MSDGISIVGKWRCQDGALEAIWEFGDNGEVRWDVKEAEKSGRCKATYRLDETVTPTVVQLTNVEILEMQISDNEKKPFIEDDLVMGFYQDFDGPNILRLKGLALNPANNPANPQLDYGPHTTILNRM